MLILMAPIGSETGARNSRLMLDVLLCADQQGGWKGFDSSTGFRLPDDSVPIPTASRVRLDQWQALPPAPRASTRPLTCPDLLLNYLAPAMKATAFSWFCSARCSAPSPSVPGSAGCFSPHQQDVEVCSARGDPQRFEAISLLP